MLNFLPIFYYILYNLRISLLNGVFSTINKIKNEYHYFLLFENFEFDFYLEIQNFRIFIFNFLISSYWNISYNYYLF